VTGISSYAAINAPVEEDTSDLRKTLKQMPAFIEEAFGVESRKDFISAYLAGDAIELERAVHRMVNSYLQDWLEDQRKSLTTRRVFTTDTELLSAGIRMFQETARRYPIGLPAERAK
jgi:hypothetical protein